MRIALIVLLLLVLPAIVVIALDRALEYFGERRREAVDPLP